MYVGDALVTRKNAFGDSPPQGMSVGATLGAGVGAVGATLGEAVRGVGAAVGENEVCKGTISAPASSGMCVMVEMMSGGGCVQVRGGDRNERRRLPSGEKNSVDQCLAKIASTDNSNISSVVKVTVLTDPHSIHPSSTPEVSERQLIVVPSTTAMFSSADAASKRVDDELIVK